MPLCAFEARSGLERPSTLRLEKVGASILAVAVTWRLPDSGGGEGGRRSLRGGGLSTGGGGCLCQESLVGSRPVHKNLFLEFPKYPGRFMLHFDI